MTAELVEEKKTYEFPPLKQADRSCAGASGSMQALVRVVNTDGVDLMLDAHTFAVSEAALLVGGWVVVEDIREATLNPPKTEFDKSDT